MRIGLLCAIALIFFLFIKVLFSGSVMKTLSGCSLKGKLSIVFLLAIFAGITFSLVSSIVNLFDIANDIKAFGINEKKELFQMKLF